MLGKALQRRVYSVLSDRTTFVTLLVVCGVCTVSVFHFGEAWLEWSADKYAAVFNSFSDNLVGRSLQGRLCQYVPVDVVYTWVNGSDPLFMDDLKHAKERLKATKGRELLQGCPYDDCVPSHILALDHLLPNTTKLEHLTGQNPKLSAAGPLTLESPHLACGSYVQNRSTLVMGSVSAAVVAHNATAGAMLLGLERHRVHLAHWTTDWTVPNSFQMPGFCIMTNLPHGATEEKVKNILPGPLKKTLRQFWLYDDRRLAVLESSNVTLMRQFVADYSEMELGAGTKVKVTAASLIVQMPKYADENTFGSNRYADYEQLRYSIRSLEKYAPWVRKIFLVTNGQIPYWINMDHPKLTVVTHEEIFEHRSHLPTFSSPAIEANLHRIPGISEKFLYFNDDVMLGKSVWPEDFYSEYSGHKVRLSWPLPDCSSGCPTSWVHDGYCDKACNVTECSFDGGDCLGESPRMGFGDMDQDHAFNWQDDDMSERPYCANTCMDNWLADSFCDEMCNHPECGFDAGDCGLTRYKHLTHVPFAYNANISDWKFVLPTGCTVAYWNMSALYKQYDEVGLVPLDHRDVRSVSLSDTHQVMTIVLYANVSAATLNMTLQAKNNATVVIHQLLISSNTTGHVAMENPPMDEEKDSGNGKRDEDSESQFRLPPEIEHALGDDLANMHFEKVNTSRLNITEEDRLHLSIVQQQLENEEITRKGFNVRKNKILQSYIRKYLVGGGSLKEILPGNASFEDVDSVQHRALLSLSSEDEDEEGESDLIKSEKIQRGPQRRLLDAFGDSLLHVNRMFSELYGHEARKVPAHMPFFIDNLVLSALRERFHEDWDETSSHAFRESEDMQFSFAYTHFLMGEKKSFSAAEIFDEFDTDASGTWSDREIRTLLTRMHHLPLYLETVREFEGKILNCSADLPKSLSAVPAPAYERYYDSKLPVVSRDLIDACSAVTSVLEKHFKDRKKYKHELVDDNQVAMKKLTSNVSHVVRELDDLRRNPVKFICINDDTDPNRVEDNKFVQSVLIDFFESVLPVPSTFELPAEYRNKFTHVSELLQWQFYRNVLHYATVLSFIGLAFMVLTSYLGIDVGAWLEKHVYSRMPGAVARRAKERTNYAV